LDKTINTNEQVIVNKIYLIFNDTKWMWKI
jgi:hypothetical protein